MTNQTAPQDKQEVRRPTSQSQHLPVVITSEVARNRIMQMKSNIANVKMMNPQKFGGFVNR